MHIVYVDMSTKAEQWTQSSAVAVANDLSWVCLVPGKVKQRVRKLLSERYGPKWPLQWGVPLPEEEEALRASPFACEWRYLRDLLTYNPAPTEARLFRELARQGLELRNRPAHYQPVKYAAFANFWRAQAILYEQ